MAKVEFVSFNQDINDAKSEVKELQGQGYIVIDSYGNDFDMGNIYEYALGKDKNEVLKRHNEYVKKFKE